MQAYTYSVLFKSTGQIYYGCRKSTSFDLFKTYFTSSKLVRRLIQEHGIEAFDIRFRQKFDSYAEARKWETKFLQKVNAPSNHKFFNQAISSPRLCVKDSKSEEIRRSKISESMKKLWKQDSYKNQFIDSTKPGSKYRKKEPAKSRSLGLATITKNGEIKQVKRNYVPAYKKYGWTRI